MVVKSDDILICWKISFVAFSSDSFEYFTCLFFSPDEKGLDSKMEAKGITKRKRKKSRQHPTKSTLEVNERLSFTRGTWLLSPGHVTSSHPVGLSLRVTARPESPTACADFWLTCQLRQQFSFGCKHACRVWRSLKGTQVKTDLVSETFAVLLFVPLFLSWSSDVMSSPAAPLPPFCLPGVFNLYLYIAK